jgi:type VI protein secretion system component Hcp
MRAQIKVLSLIACVAIISVAFATAKAAGSGSTMTITGLTGNDSSHTFGVNSFEFEITAADASGGASSGKSTWAPLVVRHDLKAAESDLIEAANEGIHLESVLVVIKVADVEALRFTLTDVVVSSASLSGKGGAPETSFSPREIAIETKGATYCFNLALSTSC